MNFLERWMTRAAAFRGELPTVNLGGGKLEAPRPWPNPPRAERDPADEPGGVATAWPAPDVVQKLVEAADLLLDTCNFDGDGWEQIHEARAIARRWLTDRNPENAPGSPRFAPERTLEASPGMTAAQKGVGPYQGSVGGPDRPGTPSAQGPHRVNR